VGAPVAERIAAHGWKVVKVSDGYIVPLSQPQRGLIPLLLDAQGVAELVGGERVYPTTTDRRNGPMTVSGFTCIEGGRVNGPVTVKPGATLIATGTTFNGPISASGAAGFFLANSTVNGAVQVAGTNGPVSMVDVKVAGPVRLADSTGSTAPLLARNTVNGPLNCTGNTPAPSTMGVPNTVKGPRAGQCAAL